MAIIVISLSTTTDTNFTVVFILIYHFYFFTFMKFEGMPLFILILDYSFFFLKSGILNPASQYGFAWFKFEIVFFLFFVFLCTK